MSIVPTRCAIAMLLAGVASSAVLAQKPPPSVFAPPTPETPSKVRSVPAETTEAARTDPSWKAPRTAWGDPDLQGVWTSDDMRGIPLNRPESFGTRDTLTEKEFLGRAGHDEGSRDRALNEEALFRDEVGVRTFGYSSLVVDPPDGRIPALTPAAAARSAARGRPGRVGPFNGVNDFSLYDRCITRGLLGSLLPVIYGNGLRIVQTPSSVVLSYEMVHDTRVIPLGDAARLDPAIRQYMGSSVGHWEGNTLVVETTNFTNKTSIGLNGSGPQHSRKMRITERLTRVDPDMIDYVARVEDPETYTKPFTIRMTITHQPNYKLYEYSCHEGNSVVRNALAGERAYEKKVAEAVAKGLPVPKRANPGLAIYSAPDENKPDVFDVNAGN